MKNLTVNFQQRAQLFYLLSQQEGPLGRTAPFLRVLTEVRFSDAENTQIIKLPYQVNGKVVGETIHPPQDSEGKPLPDWGKKKIKIEDADAAALLALLREWPKFLTNDHVWADPLVKALETNAATA